MPGTVTLHRVIRAPAERIYRAFITPAAMVKWLPPHGFTGEVHSMDARVGGSYRMSFTNFGTGGSQSFGCTEREKVPGEKLRYEDQLHNPQLPGTMEVEITLKPGMVGTDVSIVQKGIPDSIPVEFCYLGWQESLEMLAKLVEPEIPDGA